MSFLRRIFGLGQSGPKTKKRTSKYKFSNPEGLTILPLLVSEKSKEVSLGNELVQVFHNRENIYSKIVIVLSTINNQQNEIGQISSENQTEDELTALSKLAIDNIDQYNVDDLIFWDGSEMKYDFKILSAPIDEYSSEKILSKKQMLKAHQMLGATKLLVSIARRGLIFICDQDILSEEQLEDFLGLHYFAVLNDKFNGEILCEDLFVLEDGEIIGSLEINEISEKLRSINNHK